MSSMARPELPPDGVSSPLHNLGGWPSHWARIQPARPAVEDAERSLNWKGFEDRIGGLAAWLRAQRLAPGERVAVFLRNRTAALEILFGTARLGGIYLPINLRLTAREIAFQLDDARPAALFFESDLQETIDDALALARHAPPLSVPIGSAPNTYEAEIERRPPVREALGLGADDPAILMYTSGTTGTPKGALLPHRKALFNSLNAQGAFQTTPDDRVLVVAPLFHSLGLQILSLPLLHAGGSLLLQDRFEPAQVWKAVSEQEISYLGGVPEMHQRLYDALLLRRGDPSDFPRLRFLFSAGAAISTELIRRFADLDLTVLQGYGQTETSTLCCLDAANSLRKAGSVGRPVRHGEIRIIARESIHQTPNLWRETGIGETGEIVVRGPINMIGYWERERETRETLIDGWIKTGDLATRDEEGFLSLVGRAREMLISGGENVYPAEVEAVYREYPGIREVAIVGVPDPKWGETGRAHVILDSGHVLDQEALLAWARQRLASFKLPREIVIEEEFPRTASGKIRKHLLGNSP